MKEPTAGDRNRVVVLFALVGAALGVVLAMLVLTTGSDGYGRTDITESTALTAITMGIGFGVGHALSGRSESVSPEITIGVLSLTSLVGAAMGWLVGSVLEHPPISPGRAMAIGTLAGLLVGALVLVPRWLWRTRS